jgi:hypothetical protein
MRDLLGQGIRRPLLILISSYAGRDLQLPVAAKSAREKRVNKKRGTNLIPVVQITVSQIEALVGPHPLDRSIRVPLPRLIGVPSDTGVDLDLRPGLVHIPRHLQAERVEDLDLRGRSAAPDDIPSALLSGRAAVVDDDGGAVGCGEDGDAWCAGERAASCRLELDKFACTGKKETSLDTCYSDAVSENTWTYAGIAARAPATAMAMNDVNAKKPMSIKCK